MAIADFSLKALYDAIDGQRRARHLTWAAVAREVNRVETLKHSIATSTIRSLETKQVAEGDGVLAMLGWLGRSPEVCVGFKNTDAPRYRLADPGKGKLLRWDAKALYSALAERKQARVMSWQAIAEELGAGFAPAMLTRLAKGGRVTFPAVMRIVQWLERPAATFTRVSGVAQRWR